MQRARSSLTQTLLKTLTQTQTLTRTQVMFPPPEHAGDLHFLHFSQRVASPLLCCMSGQDCHDTRIFTSLPGGVNYSGPYCYDIIRHTYYKSWLSSGFWRQVNKGTQSLRSYQLCRDCVFDPPSEFQAAHMRSITYFTDAGAEGACRYYQRR